MAGKTALSQVDRTWAGDIGVGPEDLRLTAASDPKPGLVFALRVAFGDANTNTQTFTLPYAWKVIDVTVAKRGGTGGAGNTLQLKQGSNAVTDAIDTSGVTGVLLRPVSIFTTYDDVNAAAALSVINTKSSGNSALLVTIYGIRTG